MKTPAVSFLIGISIASAILIFSSRFSTLQFGRVFPEDRPETISRIKSLESRIESLGTELSTSDAKARELEGQVQLLQSKVVSVLTLGAGNVKPEREVDGASAQLENAKAPEDLKGQLELQKSQMETQASRIEEQKSEIERLRTSAADQTGLIESLTNSLGEQKVRVENQANDLVDQKRELDTLRGQVKTLQASLTSAKMASKVGRGETSQDIAASVHRGDDMAKVRSEFGRPDRISSLSYSEHWYYSGGRQIVFTSKRVSGWKGFPVEPIPRDPSGY